MVSAQESVAAATRSLQKLAVFLSAAELAYVYPKGIVNTQGSATNMPRLLLVALVCRQLCALYIYIIYIY